jgi:hypothetical protein
MYHKIGKMRIKILKTLRKVNILCDFSGVYRRMPQHTTAYRRMPQHTEANCKQTQANCKQAAGICRPAKVCICTPKKKTHNSNQAQNIVTKSGSKPVNFSESESGRTEVQKGGRIYF